MHVYLDSLLVTGLLIVNADDFGGNPLATDRIVECFAARRITSTSAMVHMKDSARAARLAQNGELAVGLHLNLTQAFDDPETPAGVRERQARAVAYFAGGTTTTVHLQPPHEQAGEGMRRRSAHAFP